MDRAQRDAIVRRDGYACRACGRSTRGRVHHILGRGQGGSDAPANLVTLCGRCHMLVSPIPVEQLLVYFGIDEDELLVRKARVEVAVHAWVLSSLAAPPAPPRRRKVRRARPTRPRKPTPVPEWKRLRPRAGRVWEPGEDAALLAEFDSGLPLPEIAARRGRGVFSIQVRLCKLGRGASLRQDGRGKGHFARASGLLRPECAGLRCLVSARGTQSDYNGQPAGSPRRLQVGSHLP